MNRSKSNSHYAPTQYFSIKPWYKANMITSTDQEAVLLSSFSAITLCVFFVIRNYPMVSYWSVCSHWMASQCIRLSADCAVQDFVNIVSV